MTSTVTLTEALRAARDTRCLQIGERMLGAAPRIFRDYFGSLPAMVVADTTTFAAAGQVLHDILRAAGVLDDCLSRIFGPGGFWPLPGGAPKSTSASR